MTSFAGYDALDIPPNRVSTWGSSVTRTVDRAENAQGNVVTTTTSAIPRTSRTLEWICATRADLAALEAFLAARQGRLVPCWIPTYQRDLDVVGFDFAGTWHTNLGTSSPALATLIPSAYPWQFWTAFRYGAPRLFTHRNTAGSIGAGVYGIGTAPGTFILDVNGPWPLDATSATGAIFSRLVLMRLATDEYRVEIVAAAAIVTADFVEAPDYPFP